jgi:alpha-ketoglutarate-dependent taurine dioxygenase
MDSTSSPIPRAPRAAELSAPQLHARPALPVVLEPPSTTSAPRCSISEHHAPQIMGLLDKHGAVLLRGWSVPDTEAFATAISTLCRGCELASLADYFPAEHGRDQQRVVGEDPTTIWPTNGIRRTGGYLQPEVVPHTECFYAMKQPRVCAFFCERPAWLGGETALFDGCAAFSALPSSLRSKLGQDAAVRRLHTLSRLRDRHGAAILGRLPSMAAEAGTAWRLVDEGAADPCVELTFRRVVASATPRPPLAAHPNPAACGDGRGGKPVQHVCFNFGELSQLPAARHALLRGLLRRGLFAGRKWAVHRILWKLALVYPNGLVQAWLSALDSLPGWLTRPRSVLRARADARRVAATRAKLARMGKPKGHGRTLLELLSERESEQLAETLGEHVEAVQWRTGDILLIDNARVLHDGLPGFGPFRKLHVALLVSDE